MHEGGWGAGDERDAVEGKASALASIGESAERILSADGSTMEGWARGTEDVMRVEVSSKGSGPEAEAVAIDRND